MPGDECSLGYVDGADGHVPGTVSGDAIRGDFLAEMLGTAVGARTTCSVGCRCSPLRRQIPSVWIFI